MSGGMVADLVTLLFYAAVIVLLVRPGSNGPSAVQAFAQSLAGLIQAATAP